MPSLEIELDEVLKTFLAETDEQLAEVEEALVALEIQPDDSEAIQSIFRAAHTLKGNAASMGFAGVAELAHALEDLLDRIRDHALAVNAQVVTLLLRAVDALRWLVPEASQGRAETHPAQSELLRDIASVCGSLTRAEGSSLAGLEDSARSASTASNHRTLRVDLGRLDKMLELSGEIAVAQGRLAQVLRHAGEDPSARVSEPHTEAMSRSSSL